VSLVVFNTNHEAELLGECVPKPELGNEEDLAEPSLWHEEKFITVHNNPAER